MKHSNRAAPRAKRVLLSACGFLGIVGAWPSVGLAADYIWSGDSHGDVHWSNGDNWGGVAPINNTLANLIFDEGALILTPSQDIAKQFNLNSITFAPGAGNFVLSGNTIGLVGDATIHQNSDNLVTVQERLNFGVDSTYAGTGSAVFSGALSGQGLTVDNPGTLTISGGGSIAHLFISQGTTAITAGVLNLTNPGSGLAVVGNTTPVSMSITGGAVVNGTGGLAIIDGVAGNSVLISGAGSKLAGSFVTYAGSNANGAMTVQNGGACSSDLLLVSVSEGSFGTLNILSGGTVTNQVAAVGVWPATATLAASHGVATISGPGSLWTLSDSFHIGGRFDDQNGANGVVLINNGGAVVVGGYTKMWSPLGSLTISGGTLTTGSLTSYGPVGNIDLTDPAAGSALNINGAANVDTYSGAISGSGGVHKSGGSTQFLSGVNSYTGPTIVDGGTLVLGSGASSTYTANNGGTLNLTFGNLGFSSLRANPGGTVFFTTPTIFGGYLRGGGGNFAIQQLTSFNGTTFAADMVLTQNNPLTLRNVANSGVLTSNVSLVWDGGSNTSAGSFIVNSPDAAVSAFENSGVITVNNGGVLRNSSTNFASGGGGRITVNPGGQINLGPTSLNLNGSLLVNNGTISGTTNVNFGALAKGAGVYGAVNVTDGGRFSPGNSPGAVTSGSASWNSGGSYLVELSSATGAAGSEWDLWNIDGVLSLNASPGGNGRFTISLATLQGNSPGAAANFDSARDYDWLIAQAKDGIVGFDLNELSLDVSGFANSVGDGHFSLQSTSSDLFIHFASVPEAGMVGIWLWAVYAIGARGVHARRRGL